MNPEIKKRFFAFRDGQTADVLRKAGLPHKMIFGLQIPQLGAIARELSELPAEQRAGLAEWLWNDREVRESRLLACWLFEPASIENDKAIQLARDLRSREEADILAFRVLRRTNDPVQLLKNFEEEGLDEAARALRNQLS